MRKNTLVPSLLLLGVLSLTTACTPDSEVSTASVDTGAGPSAASGVERTVDPTKIEGLDIVNDSGNGPSCPWATSYPAVPGAEPMTAAMKSDVERRLRAYVDDGCGSGNELDFNIGFDFLVASGDVVGVRLTTQDPGAAGDGTETKTYWYGGEDAQPHDALGLIAEASRPDFLSVVRERLEGREGVDTAILGAALSGPQAQQDLLDDMSVTRDGALRIDFDRSTVGVPAGGRYQVILPPAEVAPWLSGFGRRVQEQAVSPGGTLDLGAPTAEEPEPAPEASAPGADTTDCSKVKCIAMTFDDGPAVPETATLLEYLAEYDARATFFVVGQNAAAHPDVLRAEVEAGHEVGNHSWNHPDLTQLSTAEVTSQLDRTSAAIKAATGDEPTLFRPPYGAIDDAVKSATTLSPVLWDVDPEDWKYRDTERVAQTVIAQAGANDVVLLHDIHPTSVAAVPEILRTLTAQGFHFVTVSHLRATL
ncbi:polysaccharide deacetylase family protein [Promicromonospora panici]|uniref:polysaccharide deacetylase family protein n=1 Tax=Promicromonospora panici TaxID=2219658 RepID=UPI00101C7FF2|nr:polysaccharide deacetylase family protein [Promicromonospora panici]